MHKLLLFTLSILILLISALTFSVLKLTLSIWLSGFFVFIIVSLIMLFMIICNAMYLGLGLELKFSEAIYEPETYHYKHLQMNYGKLQVEIQSIKQECERIPEIRSLITKGDANIHVLLFDNPEKLEDPEMARSCIGLKIKSHIKLREEVYEKLEGNPGMNSKSSLPGGKVLITRFPNKAQLSVTIARIKILKELQKLAEKNEYNGIFDPINKKLLVPVGEIFKGNEIICYVPIGDEHKQYAKLTQYKESALIASP